MPLLVSSPFLLPPFKSVLRFKSLFEPSSLVLAVNKVRYSLARTSCHSWRVDIGSGVSTASALAEGLGVTCANKSCKNLALVHREDAKDSAHQALGESHGKAMVLRVIYDS